MALYGTQVKPYPGAPSIGYGPAGQAFDPSNPVAMTTSGVRPLSVANNRVTPAGQATPPAVSAQTLWQTANPLPGSRLGREAAAREQALYGVDRYGGTPPGGATGGTGTGGTAGGIGSGGNISTGINATLPPGATDAARISMLRSAGVPLAGQAIGDLAGQYGDLTRALLSADYVDLARLGAFREHQLRSDMESARANAGLGWGNIGAGLDALNIQDILGQSELFNDRLRLASSLFN